MEYIIGFVALTILIFTISLFWRKKLYKEVDKLEQLKLEIQHRPIIEEMTKVKKLNMNGQTEELFEGWRQTWTRVLDVDLGEVDKLLFDAEECIDKLRFRESAQIREEINVMLIKAEVEMNQILVELEELMGSDEKNRIEMETIQADFKEAKKELFAQRHTYCKAAEAIERKIEALDPKLMQYNEMTLEGNYLAARELVLTITDELAQITHLLAQLPDIYNEIHYALPAELTEMKDGFEEMVQAGYPLAHVPIEKDTITLQQSIEQARTHVNRLEITEAEELIINTHQKIDSLYDFLEKEVDALANIKQCDEPTAQRLDQMHEQNTSLRAEIEFVCQGYTLNPGDLDIPKGFDKRIGFLHKKYAIIKERIGMNETAYSTLWSEMNAIREELNDIQPAQQSFKEQLQSLRQDEVKVRELKQQLKFKLKEQERMLRITNLPCFPEYILNQARDAHEQLSQLEQSLSEKPLNIVTIQQHAATSNEMIDAVYNDTNDMIKTAQSVERVIQYGNRYRSKYEAVYIGLSEAELLFRKGQYQEALEKAAEAVESVEPGALKRIEELSPKTTKEDQYA